MVLSHGTGVRIPVPLPSSPSTALSLLFVLACGAGCSASFEDLYHERCAACHGGDLKGSAEGTPLVGGDLTRGDSMDAIVRSISEGNAEEGMPAWDETLSEAQIRSLAILISEERANTTFADFRMAPSLQVTDEVMTTELHRFRLEAVITGLDPLPYSIAPLPDGGLLLTEKMRGLSMVSADGVQSPLIVGAPKGHRDDAYREGPLHYGTGWILDVAIHPDYEKNGWIYLSYGHRCDNCGGSKSMGRLVRGRITDDAWVDEEVIWEADPETYNGYPDMALGGRIAFADGHVYLSIGMKTDGSEPQDLTHPTGKIHRMFDDSAVPEDNPFVTVSGALPTVWTYGHRSPQGLEHNHATGELWSTEMGPRGGDEVNLIERGRNYGWPVSSEGMHYTGQPVDGTRFGIGRIDVDPATIVQPVVDLTPSVAISSFVFYSGSSFPEWRGQMLAGSLKGSDLYRFRLEDGRLVQRETLIEDLARFRDVEVGADGTVYLLLEHEAGSQILKMVPAG